MILTCVGDCGVDTYVDHHITRPGGIILNFAVHARKTFPSSDIVQVISPLGNDTEAHIVEEVTKKHQIVSYFSYLPGKTPTQYIDHDARGEKVFTKYEEGVLQGFSLGKKEVEILHKSDVVMTVIYTEVEPLFNSVIHCKPKQYMAVDFMDLSNYGRTVDVVKKYIHQLDIAFYGLRSEQTQLLHDLQELASVHKKLFVITLGPDGSMVYERNKKYFEKAIPVENIVDTTGAGDAFAASFIKEYVYTKNVSKSLKAGNEKAAEVVQQLGTF